MRRNRMLNWVVNSGAAPVVAPERLNRFRRRVPPRPRQAAWAGAEKQALRVPPAFPCPPRGPREVEPLQQEEPHRHAPERCTKRSTRRNAPNICTPTECIKSTRGLGGSRVVVPEVPHGSLSRRKCTKNVFCPARPGEESTSSKQVFSHSNRLPQTGLIPPNKRTTFPDHYDVHPEQIDTISANRHVS